MRKIIILLCVLTSGILTMQGQSARQMAAMLTQMQKGQEVTPDSFYIHVDFLRRAVAEAGEPTDKAVYSATLAHLLTVNTYRAQTHSRETESHPDSLREWSREEYVREAARLYKAALSRPEVLFHAPAGEWVPLISEQKEQPADMLGVIWKAALNDIPDGQSRYGLPSYARMEAFYRSMNRPNEALGVMLDSVNRCGDALKPTLLTELRHKYEAQETCAEVYLRQSQLPDLTQEQRRDLLQEGIRNFPKYWRRGALENALMELSRPMLWWSMKPLLYPETEVKTKLHVRNVKSATFALYRVPNDFDVEQPELLKAVKRQGKRIRTMKHTFREKDGMKQYTDTLRWTTPGFGHYALVSEGRTPAKLCEKTAPQISFFRVSAMSCIVMGLPGIGTGENTSRLMVVDARSGRPMPDVQVSYMEQKADSLSTKLRVTTDARGIVQMPSSKLPRNCMIRLEKGEDNAWPAQHSRTTIMGFNANDPVRKDNVRLFTDRAVYRPGQKVYVSAIVFDYRGQQSSVSVGREVTLTYLDANNQEMQKHTLTTDSFGVAADSILLPASVLPGTFRVRSGSASCRFRVEEYKRPSFRVEFAESDTVRWPLERVKVSGTVSSYTGVPMADARVCGTFRWTGGLWRMGGYEPDEEGRTDTVFTDAEGRFALWIPVDTVAERYQWGRRLSVEVDVLSPFGETQQAQFGMPLCSQALRLRMDVPPMQDRDRLTPWLMKLIGPDDKPVTADIECTLTDRKGLEVLKFKLPANTKTIPDGLKALPGGSYTLKATATVGKDSATEELTLTLFGMDDTRVPVDTALWVYCPRDTFSTAAPARIQLGTSLDTAWVYCVMLSPAGIAKDTLMTLHNEMRVLDIPYRTEYADGASLQFCLYSEGKYFFERILLKRESTPRRLTAQWETFRDYLRPGQQEEWRLRLTNPDGSPARANLMCTLYDAALDAISAHRWSFEHYIPLRIPEASAWPRTPGSRSVHTPFCLRLREVPFFGFPAWNEELFQAARTFETSGKGMVFRSSAPTMMKSAANTQMAYDSAVAEENVAGAMPAYEAEYGTETETKQTELRTEMQELAFFRPTLRTDAEGRVSIAFTLPESLTSWHLMGLAHTARLFTTQLDETIVARKDFMARLRLPRYFRAGDRAVLTATLQNLTEADTRADATLTVMDAATGKTLRTEEFKALALPAGKETTHRIEMEIPGGTDMITVRWTARTATASDGEQHALPILADEQTLTETKAFHIDGPQQWRMNLDKLFGFDNRKATARRLTVEYTARPVWLALQALPSMVEEREGDVLSVASACYATTLARHIALAVPNLRQVIAEWEAEAQTGTLAKNAELTDLLLQEMPWMAENADEETRRSRLAALMTEAYSPSALMAITRRLADLQEPDGTFAWFPGMKGNTHMTTRVLTLLSRLQSTASEADIPEIAALRTEMIQRGLKPLHRALERQAETRTLQAADVLEFLYVVALNQTTDQYDDYLNLLQREAETLTRENRARAAIVLHAAGRKAEAARLMPELRRVIGQSDGFYLAYPGGAHYSIDRKLENHVLVMEAFRRIAPQDTEAIRGLEQWLLMQKRVQDWGQPIRTADAIHALVQGSSEILADTSTDRLTLTDKAGRSHTLGSPESALGYVRTALPTEQPRTLRVEKRTPGLSWGAVYAQYRMPLSAIEAQREGLGIRREITAAEGCRTGDRLHVRYTLTVDHDMEFVTLSAPRPAAAEPATQRSGMMHFGSVGAYRAIRDARTDYFFDRLPRGTYVIEEDWLLTAPGHYQLGAAALRSVYAPEFQAHSEGASIEIK